MTADARVIQGQGTIQDAMVKRAIAQRFDAAAETYDHAAVVQQRVAQHLLACCTPLWQDTTRAPRHLIDAGCGSGFLTHALSQKFSRTDILALDIAPRMVALCQQRCVDAPRVICQVADVANIAEVTHTAPRNVSTDWLLSSLCLQWLPDWRATLRDWAQHVQHLAFSVPVQGSFAAWQAAHQRAGYTAGLYPLPEAEALRAVCETLGTLQHFSVQRESLHHDHALDFARTLRALGASQPRPGHQPVALRRIVRELPEGVDAEYLVAYVVLASATAP